MWSIDFDVLIILPNNYYWEQASLKLEVEPVMWIEVGIIQGVALVLSL